MLRCTTKSSTWEVYLPGIQKKKLSPFNMREMRSSSGRSKLNQPLGRHIKSAHPSTSTPRVRTKLKKKLSMLRTWSLCSSPGCLLSRHKRIHYITKTKLVPLMSFSESSQ
jgi:hypothetical protein